MGLNGLLVSRIAFGMPILKQQTRMTNRQQVQQFVSREFMKNGFYLVGVDETVWEGNFPLEDERTFHSNSSRHVYFSTQEGVRPAV
jgi:hypothetical protein